MLVQTTPSINAITRAKARLGIGPPPGDPYEWKYQDPVTFDPDKIREEQKLDKEIAEVRSQLLAGKGVDKFCLKDQLVQVCEQEPGRGVIYRIWAPKSMRPNIVSKTHTSYHEGRLKTLHRIANHFWWQGLEEEVGGFVQLCDICQQAGPYLGPPVKEGHLKVVWRPRYQLYVDILGSLPLAKGLKKVLVAVDACSRYLYAEGMPSEEAPTVIRTLERVFVSSDIPRVLVSDNGGTFKSQELKEFLENRGVEHRFTCPYNPRSNSLAEGGVKSILNYLRSFCEDKPSCWPKYLQVAVRAHNTAYHRTLNDTPYFIHTGTDPLVQEGGVKKDPEAIDKSELFLQIEYCRKLAAKHIIAAQNNKDQLNLARHIPTFQVGNLVFVKNQFVSERGYKLRYRYNGPYRIQNIEGNTALLKSLASGKEVRVSLRNVKLYHHLNLTTTETPNVNQPFPSPEGDIPE